MAMFEVDGFRFFDDDGSESAATPLAAEDTSIVRAPNTPTRLRLQVNMTNSTYPSSVGMALQFRRVGDGIDWASIGESVPYPNHLTMSDSTFIADFGADVTTARLTPPTGKTSGVDFVAGKIRDDDASMFVTGLGDSPYTEMEWCFTTDSAYAYPTFVYEFRLYLSGVGEETATMNVTPQLTITGRRHILIAP